MKVINLIFVIPLILITMFFIDGKSQADVNFLTRDKINLIDSTNFDVNSKLPMIYYLDTTIKEQIDTLLTEFKKTDSLQEKLKDK